jgi:drug/metabolite transporter (DMT)-like permease
MAFASIYVIWGSTYLAIRIAIETIPPFLMAAVRFLVAGGLLLMWARLRGAPWPSRRELGNAALVGALLLLVGNGAVVWAEQWVPSGLAALLVATVPLWIVLVDWGWGRGRRPGPILVAGLVWGLFGVTLLAGGEGLGAGGVMELMGGAAILVGTFSWAAGSILSREAPMPRAPRMAVALEMLSGGLLLLALSALVGEPAGFQAGAVSMRSALALVYLIVFGALVAFSAYIWLLGVAEPARVSTYAYVNPVVALLLGWAVAEEPLGLRTLLGSGVILSAVMLISARTAGGRLSPDGGGSSGGGPVP